MELKTQRYCPTHGPVLAVKQETRNLFHLMASVFTLGIWLPFWGIYSIADSLRPYRCPHCGDKCTRKPQEPQEVQA